LRYRKTTLSRSWYIWPPVLYWRTSTTLKTRKTVTGASWGSEIETHFVDEIGKPIPVGTTRKILAATPAGLWSTTIDLGRQLIELVTAPQASPEELHSSTLEGLHWLYAQAAQHGAKPIFVPSRDWPSGELLWIQDNRDTLWTKLDGQSNLERLCRIASVQITLSVHPMEIVPRINDLWEAGLHLLDYSVNDAAWQSYIAESEAGYNPSRYAGPRHFLDLEHYVCYLESHHVVMYRDQACNRRISSLYRPTSADLDLFVRSIWLHYRARVFTQGNLQTSAIEIRPFARRDDASIKTVLDTICQTLTL
jgi:hypothetical protein